MINDMEQLIRERAYELWVLNGRVEGHAQEHWLEAERQVRTAHAAQAIAVSQRPKLAAVRKAVARRRPAGSGVAAHVQ